MSAASSRLAEVDALRGIAVLMVVVFHYTTRLGELFPTAAWGDFRFGEYGVHLFFVISGFVIIMTLDRSERTADFLVARFSRLYPAYWTAILLTSAFVWLVNGPIEPPSFRQVAFNFTMVHGFFKVPAVDGVYWTLEVELLFYAMALAVFSAGLLRRPYVPILAWLSLSALFYSALWRSVEDSHLAAFGSRLLILEFAPFFVLGIMFYRLYRAQGAPAANLAVAAAAFVLVLAKWPFTLGLLIAGACYVLWKLGRGGLPVLQWRPLVFFGTISYALYLVHQKIGHAVLVGLAGAGWNAPSRFAAATLFTVALATAITFLVEQPALREIRRRYKTHLKFRDGARIQANSGSGS